MRKTVKKALALILLLSLAVPLVSGCAGGGALKLQSGLAGDENFHQDRPYALDADQVAPTGAEFKRAEEYLTQNILESAENGSLAFDFAVDGAYFSEVFTTYEKSLETTADDDTRTDYTLTYTKAGEPLTVTVYATLYKTLPVIEWTVWLENTSDANTGIITEFYGLTDTFGQSDDGDYKLLTFKGSRQAPGGIPAPPRHPPPPGARAVSREARGRPITACSVTTRPRPGASRACSSRSAGRASGSPTL